MSLFELKSFPDAVLAETGIMLLPFQGFSLHFEQIKTFLKKLIILYIVDIWEKSKCVFDMK